MKTPRSRSLCFSLAWLILGCVCPSTRASEAAPRPAPSKEPFFNARKRQTEYAGPGREDPAPADVKEVLLGYFGPSDPAHPEGGDMWSAAQMAVEEANRRGGYQGKPFRLVPAWSENPWGTGVAKVARMVYSDNVWAIVGGIDSASTHLAEQVVAKARLVLISPASTDKTVNLANVPWMFSCAPGDHLQVSVLAAAMRERIGGKPFVLVSTDEHDARRFAVELRKCLGARRMVPRYHFRAKRGSPEMDELVRRSVQSKPGAVVLIAGARESARLLLALREQGFSGPVFGGPWMARRTFLEEAGAAAEGAVFPLLNDPQAAWGEFAKTFKERFDRSPDYAAAHTYDAVRLLIAAVHKAGLNRARIRDAVEELSPWSGVAGVIQWDPLGANTRPVHLGTIRNGQVVPVGQTSKQPRRGAPR